MASLPGSLDYLYHAGIIDHIPYEAYEMGPITPSGYAQMSGYGMGYALPQMNATQYLNYAQKGNLYRTHMLPDIYVKPSVPSTQKATLMQELYSDGVGYSENLDMEVMANGQEGKNFRLKLKNAVSKVYEKFCDSPDWFKGVIAAGTILLTVCCLFRGIKPPTKVLKK